MTIDNRTKKLISFFVSSILVSGNVMAVDSWGKFKADYATKNKPKANNLNPAYLVAGSAGLLSIPAIALAASRNKNDSPSSSSISTRTSSPTSNSPSSTRFIPQTFTRPSPSNKLDKNVENKCQHTIELYKNVFCSVWKGNILTVRPETYKEGDKIAVMVPDNEFLKPTDGSLAEAIALNLLGKKEYEYSDSSLEQKFKTNRAAVGTEKNDITLVHAWVPKKPENMTNTVTKMKDSSPLDNLRTAYLNGFFASVLSLSEELNVKYRIINLPLLGDGSAGWTTDETLSCLFEALNTVSQTAKKYEEAGGLKEPIYINIVIHPKYNTTKDSKTKTEMVMELLKKLKEIIKKNNEKTKTENKEKPIDENKTEITKGTIEEIINGTIEENKEENKEKPKEETIEEPKEEPKKENDEENKDEITEGNIEKNKTEITEGNIDENKTEITEKTKEENKGGTVFIERAHHIGEKRKDG